MQYGKKKDRKIRRSMGRTHDEQGDKQERDEDGEAMGKEIIIEEKKGKERKEIKSRPCDMRRIRNKGKGNKNEMSPDITPPLRLGILDQLLRCLRVFGVELVDQFLCIFQVCLWLPGRVRVAFPLDQEL